MGDALKSLIFIKKVIVPKEIFFFIVSYCHGKAFLWKNLSGKFLRTQMSGWKHSVFNSCWIKTNLTGWRLLAGHNYIFKFILFNFFRLNWVEYLFRCNTGTLRKQNFLSHLVPYCDQLKACSRNIYGQSYSSVQWKKHRGSSPRTFLS